MAISSAPLNGAGSGEAYTFNSATTSQTFALGAAPSAGEIIVALVAAPSNGQKVTSIVQTGVVWSVLERSINVADVEVWLGVVGAGASANITVSTQVVGTTTNVRLNFSRWSGTDTGKLDSSSSTAPSGATTARSGQITPHSGRNVLFVASIKPAATVSAPGGGFTALTSGSTTTSFSYRVVPSTSGSYESTVTVASTNYDGVIAAIGNPVVVTSEAVARRRRR